MVPLSLKNAQCTQNTQSVQDSIKEYLIDILFLLSLFTDNQTLLMFAIGGDFNRTASIRFSANGERVSIRQNSIGRDAQGHMRMNTFVDGNVPNLSAEAKVEVDDYKQEYRRVAQGHYYTMALFCCLFLFSLHKLVISC